MPQEAAHRPLVHGELVHRKEPLALHLAVEGQVDLIVPRLQPDFALEWQPAERPRVGVPPSRTVDEALVVLLDPVAGHVGRPGFYRRLPGVEDRTVSLTDEAQPGVLEEGEVAEQRELVAARVYLK